LSSNFNSTSLATFNVKVEVEAVTEVEVIKEVEVATEIDLSGDLANLGVLDLQG
jgi:hypothetical protein